MLQMQLSVALHLPGQVADSQQAITMFSARTCIAPVMRTTARPQAIRLTIGRRLASTRAPATISDAITRDHRDLQRYYNEIVNNKGDLGA